MPNFHLSAIACGHCETAVRRTRGSVDPDTQAVADRGTRMVEGAADVGGIADAPVAQGCSDR